MAEETVESVAAAPPSGATQAPQTQQAVAPSPEVASVFDAINLGQQNVDNPFLKELAASKSAQTQTAVKPEEKTSPVAAEIKTDEPAVATPTDTTKPEDKGAEVDSPLFGGKKTIGAAKEKTEIKGFENEAALASFVKKEFGQEVTGLKDMDKFLGSAKKWRTDSQKLPDLEKKVADAERILSGAPEPIFNALKAFYQGGDWEKEIDGRSRVDYNKGIETYDKKALINNYFPGKFSEEYFSDEATEEQTKAVEIAEESSKQRYIAEKTAFENKRAGVMQSARDRQTALKQSVSGTVSSLKEAFPDLADDDVKNVSDVLEGGAQKIMGEFFNADGTCKKDAAEKLVMARYAKGLIDQLQRYAANRATTKVTEEILSRTPNKPSEGRPSGGGDAPLASKEVQGLIQGLIGDLVKKPTY